MPTILTSSNGNPCQPFDKLTFKNRQEGEDSVQFDVIMENYDWCDDVKTTQLQIGFKMTLAHNEDADLEDAETEEEQVCFGEDGEEKPCFAIVPTTSVYDEVSNTTTTIDVTLDASEGSIMKINYAKLMDGAVMTHDPTFGFLEDGESCSRSLFSGCKQAWQFQIYDHATIDKRLIT